MAFDGLNGGSRAMRKLGDIVIQPARTGVSPSGRTMSAENILVELGFGNGEFTEHLARNNPDSLVFGIEVSRSCVLKAAVRASRRSIPNMYVMCGDARFLLREFFPDDSIRKVYMNFPCPWPKSRHEKRRLTGTCFAQDLASVLEMHGEYELTTDVENFAVEMADVLAGDAALEVKMALRTEERSVTTKYERKWLALGRSIFVLNARKTAQGTTKRITLGEDLDMHARFRGPLPVLTLWKGFDGQGGTLSDGLWVYRNAFQSEDGIVLLETIAIDQGFEQKYRLRIFSEEDRGIVKIDPYSFPFITPAVRKSVEDLASRLDVPSDGSRKPEDCSGNERDLP